MRVTFLGKVEIVKASFGPKRGDSVFSSNSLGLWFSDSLSSSSSIVPGSRKSFGRSSIFLLSSQKKIAPFSFRQHILLLFFSRVFFFLFIFVEIYFYANHFILSIIILLIWICLNPLRFILFILVLFTLLVLFTYIFSIIYFTYYLLLFYFIYLDAIISRWSTK